MTGKRGRFLLLALPPVLCFLFYVLTLGRGVGLGDSGELAYAVASSGVPHPPGFPTYVLLGRLAAAIPTGSIITRLNMFSALSAAVAVSGIAWLAFAMLTEAGATASTRPGKRRTRQSAALIEDHYRVQVLLAAAVSALLFGLSPAVWYWAVITEVYALNMTLLVWAFVFSYKARRSPRYRRSMLSGAWLLAGLSLGVHSASSALMLPALLLLSIPALESRWDISLIAGGLLLGACSYLYLPVAASHHPLWNWGQPDTLSRFFRHVMSSSSRQQFVKLSLDSTFALIGDFITNVFRQFWLLGGVLAIAGWTWIWRRHRSMAGVMLTAATPTIAFFSVWQAREDRTGYFLPLFALLSLAFAAGVLNVAETVFRSIKRLRALQAERWRRRMPVLALLALLLTIGPVANSAFGEVRTARLPATTMALHDVLSTVGKNGTVLTSDWTLVSAALYLQNVEGRRRDVHVIGVHGLAFPWYSTYLARQSPHFARSCGRIIERYQTSPVVRRWERGLSSDDKTFDRRLDELTAAVVQAGFDRGPVYVARGSLSLGGREDPKSFLTPVQGKLVGYRLIPQGLVAQLLSWDARIPELRGVPIRGLSAVRQAPGNYGRSLRALYANAFANTALYDFSRGQAEEARRLIKQAERLMPGSAFVAEVSSAIDSGWVLPDARPAEAPSPLRPCRT